MLHLFRAECRRFRLWALCAGLLHAGVLLFFDRLVDPLQQPAMIYQLVAGIYGVTGALLGLFQAGSYARINQWITLLHRPLAPRAILAAIAGAGITTLALAVAVPIMVMLAAHGAIGARFVDLRHVLLVPAGLLIAVIGYLAGCYAILAPRRYGWLALIPALLPTTSAAAGGGALAMQSAVVVLLGALLTSAFKPDLATPPRRAPGLVLTAITVAMGAYLVAVIPGDIAFQTAWIATGTHPLNSTPPKGGVVEATRAEGVPLIEAGLAGRHDQQAQIWREQVRLSEVFALPPTRAELPVTGALTNIAPMEFDDERRGVRWTFSHDDRLFHGMRTSDGSAQGTKGIEGSRPFAASPLIGGDGRMIAGDGTYAFDVDTDTIHQRIHLPPGEAVAAEPTAIGEAVALFSSKGVRLYDKRVLDEGDVKHPAFAMVALSAPVGNVMRIDMVELLDGYLASIVYARGAVDGPGQAWQEVIEVDGAGHGRLVARRALIPDFPLVARFAPWWISPALTVTRDVIENLLAADAPLSARLPIRVPGSIWIAAALLSLAAAIATIWLGRRRLLGARATLSWALASLLAGPAMFIAFWLIRPVPRA